VAGPWVINSQIELTEKGLRTTVAKLNA